MGLVAGVATTAAGGGNGGRGWSGVGGDDGAVDVFAGEEAAEVSDEAALYAAGGYHLGYGLAGDGIYGELEDSSVDGFEGGSGVDVIADVCDDGPEVHG